MNDQDSTVFAVFKQCFRAVREGKLILRQSARDKEFHFQDWFENQLQETGFAYETGGRNSFPDYRMVRFPEGYEVKGLAYPGREASYDSNSQVPTGRHNERTIFYLFGRYPSRPDGDAYPVLDLVLCHGDFLNMDHTYVHKNKSIRGFGSYGDILIRDRKMYVAPTPFNLVLGTAHTQTLILPDGLPVPDGLRQVGRLVRKEAENLVVGYRFDLKQNTLVPELVENSFAGQEHAFIAWRPDGAVGEAVEMRIGGNTPGKGSVLDER